MTGRTVVTPAVGELVALLTTTLNIEHYLQRTCEVAAATLGEHASVSITLRDHGGAYNVVVSDDLSRHAEEVQYGTGDGPCLRALSDGEIIHVPDLGQEARFGDYRMHALAKGVRSSLSVPLRNGSTNIGALNIYSTDLNAFSTLDRQRAEAFAAFAAGAISVARRMADQTALSEQLQEALASRSIIDQALGIIAGQNRCDTEAAFAVLRNASANSNRKLREVAADPTPDRSETGIDRRSPGSCCPPRRQ